MANQFQSLQQIQQAFEKFGASAEAQKNTVVGLGALTIFAEAIALLAAEVQQLKTAEENRSPQ